MAAYVISEVTVRDREAMPRYRELAAASITRHGGTYLARRGNLKVLEGDFDGEMIILVAFPDTAAAEAWYTSDDYAEALKLSRQALTRRLYLLEGI
jgi:uncharacterized protein (DUF1330 family)